ncbi:MAG: flagellar FliJ family protein, partial [Rhizomicrobium sp.]
FLRAIDVRRDNLNNTLQEVSRERSACQDELTDAYQDLKSLQFAYEQQEKRMAEAENRRAQSRLDEMALVRHLRKHPTRGSRDGV